MGQLWLGLDLGQANDSTALAVVEEAPVPGVGLLVRVLRRLPLGMPYPEQVAEVVKVLSRAAKTGRCELVVDATGVGRPVVDLLRAEGLDLVAVSITGGEKATSDGDTHRVPKRDLIGALQVAMQNGQLRASSRLKEWPSLVSELRDYRVKIGDSGHDSYDARAGKHDDLVLALALAVWRARPPGGPVYVSGMGATLADKAEAEALDAWQTGQGLPTMAELRRLDREANERAAAEQAERVRESTEREQLMASLDIPLPPRSR